MGRVNDRTGVGKSMLMMLMIVSVLHVLQGMIGCCEEISGNSKINCKTEWKYQFRRDGWTSRL